MNIDTELLDADAAAAENATAAAVRAADAKVVAAGVGNCCTDPTCGVGGKTSPHVPGVIGDISGDPVINGYCDMIAGALPATGVAMSTGLLDGIMGRSLKSPVGEPVGTDEVVLDCELARSEEVEVE